MSLTPSNTGSPGALTAPPTQQFHRPLQREGAAFFVSAAEQALIDAMDRSSPLPEPLLGKRTHGQVHEEDHGEDTEPDEVDTTTETTRPQESSSDAITAATLRYASRKKLRPEQRDEVEAFLQACSFFDSCLIDLTYDLNFPKDSALGRQAKLFVCVLSVENKIDAFRSATPPYQVSDELKVHISILWQASSILICPIKTNINNYAIAVLLSTNISAYKGDTPRNHILVCVFYPR